jgi:hypothetical protein
MKELPGSVLALAARGLEIRQTNDTGPYKKIIPVLREFPDAFIVTADDDIYYGPHWLRDLMAGWDGDHHQIVCHRAHFILSNEEGTPLPYNEWKQCVRTPKKSTVLFPTGAGGVLYPPRSLSNDALDENLFMKLAPRADDLWLYWMGRRAGATYKLPARMHGAPHWPGTQAVSLRDENQGASGNDIKIANLIRHYGCPPLNPLTRAREGTGSAPTGLLEGAS